MSDELKRRRPPPTAYDDPIADVAVHVDAVGIKAFEGAIEHLAVQIRAGCSEIAEAITKLAEAIESHGA